MRRVEPVPLLEKQTPRPVIMTNGERAHLRPDGSADAPRITHADRTALVDALYDVVERCGIDRDAVAAAMDVVDRFLATPSPVARGALRDRGQYGLVAAAALAVGGGGHAGDEVERMAAHLRQGLGAGLHAPTSLQIATGLLAAALPGVDLEASRWCYLLDDVRFQLEFAVRDYYFVALRPRAVAIAAVLNSLDELWGEDLRHMQRAFPAAAMDDFPPLADVRAAKERLWVEMDRGHACQVSEEMLVSVGKLLGW